VTQHESARPEKFYGFADNKKNQKPYLYGFFTRLKIKKSLIFFRILFFVYKSLSLSIQLI